MSGFFGILLLCASALAAQKDTVRYALRSEPPQLHSGKTSDVDSGFVLGHIMEGLTRYSPKGDASLSAGVAEKWTTKELVTTFHLRKDARWSDGTQVVADDFIFAWKLALKPETASQYAFILYPIKNAEAINTGKLQASELGVKAINAQTLEVTLEKPCAYFLSLTAFPTYLPIREAFYKIYGDRFAAEASTLLSNGPFKLTEWVHGAKLKMERNALYWNAKTIRLNTIEIPYITPDNSAKFNLFRDDKIDILNAMGKDDIPRAQRDKLRLNNHLDGGIFFLEFNLREGRATANFHLRKAIQLAFASKAEFVSRVIGIPGARVANSLIPTSVPGYSVNYPSGSLAEVKKHLEAARKELGGAIPPLGFLVNDNPQSDREAQYFQALFKTKLGLEFKVDKQIFKQRLAKMNTGDFDIAGSNWYPDYPDPMAYAELKAGWNKTNRGRWLNSEYDRLLREAQSTLDASKRRKALRLANQILTDDAALIPTYEGMTLWLSHPLLQGVIRRRFGPDPDFSLAHWK